MALEAAAVSARAQGDEEIFFRPIERIEFRAERTPPGAISFFLSLSPSLSLFSGVSPPLYPAIWDFFDREWEFSKDCVARYPLSTMRGD